jgi:leader peptidase (prepilin peptidase) / N-methyltransferase
VLLSVAAAAGVAVLAVSIVAAVIDARRGRIPNQAIVAGLVAVGTAVTVATALEGSGVVDVIVPLGLAITLSGAPLLAALWLIRPKSIGGGDVKLLFVQAASLGLMAPVCAGVVLPTAVICALTASLAIRRRRVPLGPGLAAGYVVALAVTLEMNRRLGGWTT